MPTSGKDERKFLEKVKANPLVSGFPWPILVPILLEIIPLIANNCFKNLSANRKARKVANEQRRLRKQPNALPPKQIARLLAKTELPEEKQADLWQAMVSASSTYQEADFDIITTV